MKSIAAHGILEPVLVWKNQGGYVILSGHNRVNAAREAGLEKVPVRVMENLTEQQASLIVTETNLRQRAFTDMSHRERALAIRMHYTAIKADSQNQRLVEAIEQLYGVPVGNGRSIERTCEEFGASQGTIARYLRISVLHPNLQEKIDKGKIPLRAGVELSWTTPEEQEQINRELENTGQRLSIRQAEELRALRGRLDRQTIHNIVNPKREQKEKQHTIRISEGVLKQYFPEKVRKQEIEEIILKALEAYFQKKIQIRPVSEREGAKGTGLFCVQKEEYPMEKPNWIAISIPYRCRDCPYPSPGFICYGKDGSCMKTEVEKIDERSRKKARRSQRRKKK